MTVNWKSFVGITSKIDSRFPAARKSRKVPLWAVDRKEVSIFFSVAFVRPMYFVWEKNKRMKMNGKPFVNRSPFGFPGCR